MEYLGTPIIIDDFSFVHRTNKFCMTFGSFFLDSWLTFDRLKMGHPVYKTEIFINVYLLKKKETKFKALLHSFSFVEIQLKKLEPFTLYLF